MVKDLMPQLRNGWTQERTNLDDRQEIPERHALVEVDVFLNTLEKIVDHIEKISKNNKEIERLQTVILGGVNQRQVPRDRSKLDEIVGQTKYLGGQVRDVLKKEQQEIDRKETELNEDNAPIKLNQKQKYQTRLKQTQISAQSRRFYEEWTIYNNLQVQFRDREKDNLKKQCKIIKADITEDEIDLLLDEGNMEIFNVSILDSTDKARVKVNELTERRDQFLDLEQSIVEIRDLFVELADLVYHQGELINNIAHNVERAEEKVEMGTTILKETVGYKSKARKKKIIYFALLFGLIFIIVLVVVGVPSPDPPTVEPKNVNIYTQPPIEPIIEP